MLPGGKKTLGTRHGESHRRSLFQRERQPQGRAYSSGRVDCGEARDSRVEEDGFGKIEKAGRSPATVTGGAPSEASGTTKNQEWGELKTKRGEPRTESLVPGAGRAEIQELGERRAGRGREGMYFHSKGWVLGVQGPWGLVVTALGGGAGIHGSM